MPSYQASLFAALAATSCNPDHTHIFLGFRPNVLISDLVKTIKTSSNALINERFCQNRDFGWL
jgi:REP element-mobilizing transposase RayT